MGMGVFSITPLKNKNPPPSPPPPPPPLGEGLSAIWARLREQRFQVREAVSARTDRLRISHLYSLS
ncbi:hypothetical protein EGT65_28010 [Burkholderia mallei]|nr:hypothetical protein EGT65_28010 [Burkholderia mallei]